MDPAAQELKLVNGVELKLALASSDLAFGKLIKLYLCPLLLKLDSPHASTRLKVIDICKMIDRRSLSETVILPFDALLAQFLDSKTGPSAKTATIGYLDRAIRLHVFSGGAGAKALFSLMNGYSQLDEIQKPWVFRSISYLLEHWEAPPDKNSQDIYVNTYGVNEPDQAQLCEKFLDLMLLNLGYFAARFHQSEIPLDHSAMENTALNLTRRQAMLHGLNEDDMAFLTPHGKNTYDMSSLFRTKSGILKFMTIPVFQAHFRFSIALVASFDLRTEIQNLASTVMRHCDDRDGIAFANQLYSLLGRPRLDYKLQARILNLLARSMSAATDAAKALKTVRTGLAVSSPKVRAAAISFLSWFARFAPAEDNQITTRELLSELTSYVSTCEASDSGRGSAFVAIGLLCKRDPQFTQCNVDIVRSLFAALSHEALAIRPSVDEALSNITHVFSGAPEPSLSELRGVLLDVVVNKPSSTHFTALKFCLATFPFSDVAARWICLLALREDAVPETIQEAKKGLDIYLFHLIHQGSKDDFRQPLFADMLLWAQDHLLNDLDMGLSHLHELGTGILDALIPFLRTSLYINALAAKGTDFMAQKPEHSQGFLELAQHDLAVRTIVQDFIADQQLPDSASPAESAMGLYEQLLVQLFFNKRSTLAGNALSELIILRPELATTTLTSRLSELRLLALTRKLDHDAIESRVLAIVLSAKQNSEQAVLRELKLILDSSGENAVSFISTLGIVGKVLLRLDWRGRQLQLDLNKEESRLLEEVQRRGASTFTDTLRTIADLAWCSRITQTSDFIDTVAKFAAAKLPEINAFEALSHALSGLSLDLSDESEDLTKIIETLLTEPNDVPKIEFYLASGRALANCLGRYDSKFMLGYLDVPARSSLKGSRPAKISAVVDRLLVEMSSPRPAKKRGAGVRLASLVQSLPPSEVHSKLAAIHRAFLGLLSDSDEVMVEVANKGIQVVYEQADQKLKDALVAQLFSTITSDAAAKQVSGNGVSAETELFQPGTMSVGSGSAETSLSTYKDICNLAIDAGNNSLIYSFLSLASSTSIWSTRSGAALGISSLLANKSTEQSIRESPAMMSRLLPKLYRYKHDPMSKVANIMGTIFNQLFPDSKAAVDENFGDVLNELLRALGNGSWRIRESAATGLSNLLLGRAIHQIASRIEEIWNLAFRVLDDVKESVRRAAVVLCRTLSNLAIKSAETTGSGNEANVILATAIPLFIKHLKSPSLEVSSSSLETLLKIAKTSGPSMRGYLPILTEEFLLLTSSMEPEALNYLSFHASKYSLSQTDLDNHRLTAMRTSPLIEALEHCVDQFDEASMAEMIPKLSQIIRQTHGLPTRAATSRFIISLVARRPALFQPHVDSILQALSATLHDRNETVVSTYASCLGYLARLATFEKLVKLTTFISKKYFTDNDPNNVLGSVLKQISQNANDRFNAMADVFLPLCFVGMHESDEKVGAVYRDTWAMNTGSTASIKLYLSEILNLVETQLTSPIWKIKQMAARSVADLAKTIDLGSSLDRVLNLILAALNGKAWTGKEAVLQALVSIVERSQEKLSDAQLQEIRQVMKREARRTNVEYKRHAFKSYALFLQLDEAVDSFDTVVEVVEDILGTDTMELDVDDDDDDISQPLRLVLVQNALECLLAAYRPLLDARRSEHYDYLVQQCLVLSRSQPWNVKSQICRDLGTTFDRIATSPAFWTKEQGLTTWRLIETLVSDKSYQSLREQAAKNAAKFAVATVAQNLDQTVRSEMQQDVLRLIAEEPSTIVQAVLRKIQFVGA